MTLMPLQFTRWSECEASSSWHWFWRRVSNIFSLSLFLTHCLLLLLFVYLFESLAFLSAMGWMFFSRSYLEEEWIYLLDAVFFYQCLLDLTQIISHIEEILPYSSDDCILGSKKFKQELAWLRNKTEFNLGSGLDG